MSRREDAFQQLIAESQGLKRGVLIDVYRHLTFAHFVGTEGKRAMPELDRRYPSEGRFEPMRLPSGGYAHAQGLASEMIQANIDRNDRLRDDVRTTLVAILADLIDRGILDPPTGMLLTHPTGGGAQGTSSGAGEWDFLFDGTPDEIREHLERRRGTSDFQVDPDGTIRLKLPKLDPAKRPAASGDTTIVTVAPLGAWNVERPQGPLAHVVPVRSTHTRCGISRESWRSPALMDDTLELTCPWCRVRLIAIELVAPAGPRVLRASRPPRAPQARDVLQKLLGQTIYTVSQHRPNRILRVEDTDVIVGTKKAPDGEPVRLAEIQAALDRLYEEGELLLNPQTTKYRSSFIAAFLATLDEVDIETNPRRAILRSAAAHADAPRRGEE